MMRPRPVLPLLLFVVGLLGFALGCNEDPTLPCNHLAGGRLQGEVRTGSPTPEAAVMATQVIDGVLSNFTFSTGTDESGFYALDLPEGDYIVQFRPGRSYQVVYGYSAAGLTYGQIPPDTLRIDDSVSPVVADFSLGSLSLQLLLTDHLNGEMASFRLYKRDDDSSGYGRTYLNRGFATIENGRAEIQAVGLFPGEYRIQVELGDMDNHSHWSYDGEDFWMPGIRDESESPWYEVGADSLTELTCLLTSEPARIEGRVSGAWLNMGLESPPRLSFVNLDSVTIVGDRRAYEDGSYGATFFLPEPVKILVMQEGIQQWIGGPGFAEATVYDLTLGETISDVDLEQSGFRLNMVGEDLRSFPGYQIRFHDPVDMGLLIAVQPWSGYGGVVPITNLWPGEYILYFTPNYFGSATWLPQWFDRVNDPAAAQIVSIGSYGEVVRLDIDLERGGSISGQLEFSSPTEGWYRVIATLADQYLLWGSTTASETYPDFSLRGLQDGSYRFGVFPYWVDWSYGEPPPEETLWYPGTGNWDEAEILDIVEAFDHVGLNIQVN